MQRLVSNSLASVLLKKMSKSAIFLVLALCVLAQGNIIKDVESEVPCLDKNSLGLSKAELSVSKAILKFKKNIFCDFFISKESY